MTRRVLIVSHVIPYFPGPGAETRAFCLGRALSRDFEITYLLPNYDGVHRPKLRALQDIGDVETYSIRALDERGAAST